MFTFLHSRSPGRASSDGLARLLPGSAARSTVVILAIGAVLVGACAAPGSPAGPSTGGGGAPSVSLAPSAAPVASPSTPVAATTPTPTSLPAAAFTFGARHATDLGMALSQPKLIHSARGFVLADGTSLWSSTNARHWTLADSPSQGNDDIAIADLAAGSDRDIAVGSESIVDADGNVTSSNAVVLTSKDGAHWTRVTSPAFAGGDMRLVAVSRQGYVAFGSTTSGPAIWTSRDTRTWLRATNASGLQVARGVTQIATVGGRLTAFVSVPGAAGDESVRVDVWQTEGWAEWAKVATLPASAGVKIAAAAFGAGRWTAQGRSTADETATSPAWSSADGIHWAVGTVPDEGMDTILGFEGGFLGVSFASGLPGTCEAGAGSASGWTSTDGLVWQPLRLPAGELVMALARVDGSVVGLGMTIHSTGTTDAEWQVPLPATLSAEGAPAAPDPSGGANDGGAACGG